MQYTSYPLLCFFVRQGRIAYRIVLLTQTQKRNKSWRDYANFYSDSCLWIDITMASRLTEAWSMNEKGLWTHDYQEIYESMFMINRKLWIIHRLTTHVETTLQSATFTRDIRLSSLQIRPPQLTQLQRRRATPQFAPNKKRRAERDGTRTEFYFIGSS